MAKRRVNPDFLNGIPEMLILRLLSQQAMYGYEIVEAIKRSSEGVLQFGEGCVYPILHRLETDGALSSKRQVVSGRSRVVYSTTAKGKKRLAASTTQWEQITAVVKAMLEGEADEQLALS